MLSKRMAIAVLICGILIGGVFIVLPLASGEESPVEPVSDSSPADNNTATHRNAYELCGYDPAISSVPTAEQQQCLIAEKNRQLEEEGGMPADNGLPPASGAQTPNLDTKPFTSEACVSKEENMQMWEGSRESSEAYIRELEKYPMGLAKAQEEREKRESWLNRIESMPDGSQGCFEMTGVETGGS